MAIRTLPKVGDLNIVKVRLARYEAGEVAHIENVMGKETRDREHRRLRQFEEIKVSEEEFEQENTRDLQTSEKFELETELQKMHREEERLAAGVSLTGSYGFVSVSAYGEYSRTTTDEESRRIKNKYAKEITERAVSKVTEKVKISRTTRSLEEIEEINHHGFINDGADHIVGVYRWVDKYYRAKRVDFGRRMMYEVYLPQPAAYYLFSLAEQSKSGDVLQKPEPPTHPSNPNYPLHPLHITDTNYMWLAQKYGADSIEPPPPKRVHVRHTISKEFDPNRHWAFSDDSLRVPGGYEIELAEYAGSFLRPTGYADSFPYATLLIGTNIGDAQLESMVYHPPEWPGGYGILNIRGQEGVIPISATGRTLHGLILNITLVCKRTTVTLEKWQLDTYAAVMNAYQKQLFDYEERLAESRIQEGVQIAGRNPARNQQIIREELRKQFLMAFSDTDFSLGDGIIENPSATPPGNHPEIDRNFLLSWSFLVPFFEELFDWDNMTFKFYPYYWAPKLDWIDANGASDPDPLFEQFLKAGQVRVVVPVRPEAETAALFFQLTRVIWPPILGPVPALPTSGNWLYDYVGDLLARLADAPPPPDVGETIEIETDDPESWLIKAPTELIWLQGTGDLPDLETPSS